LPNPSIVDPTSITLPVLPKHSSRTEYAPVTTESKRGSAELEPAGEHEPAGFEARGLSHGGSAVRYLVGGEGPPVVLVHGLGGAASNWRLIAPPLAAGRRVIVPELPGHGGSGPLGARPSLDRLAESVLAVLEHEEALPAPWVGHSLGGLVGLRAAVQRPDAVTALVLAAAAGISSGSRTGELTVTWLGRLRPERLVTPRRRRVARSRWGRTLAFGWWGVADPAGFDPAMAEAFLAGAARHTDTRPAGAALIRFDPRHDLERVGCPCLCLWGSSDHWVPLSDGIDYARRLRAPLRVIADCGHLLIGERPDAVLAAIHAFLGPPEPIVKRSD
jgi:pimeloyl-ACP methyl ester carboxylesterase